MISARIQFILIILLVSFNVTVSSQSEIFYKSDAIPTDKNFTYPQSVFVDSENGQIWVTDFSNNRVMRFDVSSLTAISEESALKYYSPFYLGQNYPNPFNPITQIKFSAEHTGNAVLTVFNLLGQKIGTLFSGVLAAETVYTVSFDAESLSGGIYFYSLETIYGSEVRKMCVLK